MGIFSRKPKSGLSHIQQIKQLEALGYQCITCDYKKVKGEKHFVVEFLGTDGQRCGIMWLEDISPEEWKKIIHYAHNPR